MAENIYPCRLKLDNDCPLNCPGFPTVKKTFDEYAAKHNMTVAELVTQLRSYSPLEKTLFWLAAHLDQDNHETCINPEEASTSTLT